MVLDGLTSLQIRVFNEIIFLFSDQTVVEAAKNEERNCSVVECLTRDQGVAGSSLTVGTVLFT